MALETWELLLRWLVAFFALLLAVIAGVAWNRSRNPRLLFVLLALLVLLANGAAFIYGTLTPDFEERWLLRVTLVSEFLVLFLLYLAVLKRNEPFRAAGPPTQAESEEPASVDVTHRTTGRPR